MTQNPWGSTTGMDVQRSDLWALDLSVVAKGLSFKLDRHAFYAQSVIMPELMTDSDIHRRNSNNVYSPGWDQPAQVVRVNFLMDANEGIGYSNIYQLLLAWRSRVRCGRGNLDESATLSSLVPNEVYIDDFDNFRPEFLFDIPVRLYMGMGVPNSSKIISDADIMARTVQPSAVFLMKRAWLGILSLSDLSQTTSGPLEIRTSFYCEELTPVPLVAR